MQETDAQRILAQAREHFSQRDFARAEVGYRSVLRHFPRHAGAYTLLARNFEAQGKVPAAIEAYERALKLDAKLSPALDGLGSLLVRASQAARAIPLLERLVVLRPQDPSAWVALSRAYFHNNDLTKAATAARSGLDAAPNSIDARKSLARAHYRQGLIEEAVAGYRKTVELAPQDADAFETLLAVIHFSAKASAREIADLHREWSRRFAEPLMPPEPPAAKENVKLRVGFVSPDLRRHPVSYFLESLFEKRDPKQWDAVCYADVPAPDDLTAKLKGLSTSWRDIYRKSHQDVAAQISEDGIDILIDLTGHTTFNRLLVFARRPAPVQATWIGYPNGTGMRTMDYLICDRVTVEDGAVELYAETPLRMPDCLSCYSPPLAAPAVAPLPALKNGFITFGCFNQISKVTDEVIAVWSELLHGVAGSRMVMRTKALKDIETRRRIHAAFASHGIDAARIDLLPPGSQLEMLQSYSLMDLALDPFPTAGGTTTCESILMGVPVISLAGDRFGGRISASYLTSVKLNGLVAKDTKGYIDLARRAVKDVPRLARVRAGLRARLMSSPLVDATRFSQSFSAALKTMWRYRDRATRPRIVDVEV
jgi:predicted O-linked N-acetylglucosamine transferase (SPINDLY family)